MNQEAAVEKLKSDEDYIIDEPAMLNAGVDPLNVEGVWAGCLTTEEFDEYLIATDQLVQVESGTLKCVSDEMGGKDSYAKTLSGENPEEPFQAAFNKCLS